MSDSQKIQPKDLMNAGIFSALYFVVVMAVAMTGYIPIMMVLLPAIGPLLAGIPFMLYLTKVRKFGMILIMGILMGLLMMFTGMGWYSLPVAVIVSLISEFLIKSGAYKSSLKAVFAHGVFSIWMWGNYIPLFFNRESYWSTRQSFGREYMNALEALLPMWMCPVLFCMAFVFGVAGGFLGKAVLNKHFKKAGIA